MNETLSRNSEFVDQAKLSFHTFVDNPETRVYGNGVNGSYSTGTVAENPRYSNWGRGFQPSVHGNGNDM